MYYTRTKDNVNDRISIEVYADYKSLVDDRAFFNRHSGGLFRVREVSESDLIHSLTQSKRSRKPDVIRIMSKDGIFFVDLPEWLRKHIRANYTPRTWDDRPKSYADGVDFDRIA